MCSHFSGDAPALMIRCWCPRSGHCSCFFFWSICNFSYCLHLDHKQRFLTWAKSPGGKYFVTNTIKTYRHALVMGQTNKAYQIWKVKSLLAHLLADLKKSQAAKDDYLADKSLLQKYEKNNNFSWNSATPTFKHFSLEEEVNQKIWNLIWWIWLVGLKEFVLILEDFPAVFVIFGTLGFVMKHNLVGGVKKEFV